MLGGYKYKTLARLRNTEVLRIQEGAVGKETAIPQNIHESVVYFFADRIVDPGYILDNDKIGWILRYNVCEIQQ